MSPWLWIVAISMSLIAATCILGYFAYSLRHRRTESKPTHVKLVLFFVLPREITSPRLLLFLFLLHVAPPAMALFDIKYRRLGRGNDKGVGFFCRCLPMGPPRLFPYFRQSSTWLSTWLSTLLPGVLKGEWWEIKIVLSIRHRGLKFGLSIVYEGARF